MGFLSTLLQGLKGGIDPNMQTAAMGQIQPNADPNMMTGQQAPQSALMGALQPQAQPQSVLGSILAAKGLSGKLGALANPQVLNYIGAALKDASPDGGNNLQSAIQGNQAQQDKLEAKQSRARQNAAFMAAYQGGKFDPQAYIKALGPQDDVTEAIPLMKALKPEQPHYVEGPDGIYAIGEDGQSHIIQKYPAKPNTSPGHVDENGNWVWAPGYIEGQGALSDVRAAAVAKHRAPPRPAQNSTSGIKWD